MTIRSVVVGLGHYLPERVVPNSEFEATLDTSDEWIKSRSGIERRHFAAEGETTSDLATKAARNALADAGLTANDLDAIVLATSTADLTFPSAATMVQAALGMNRGFAYDVQAVCAGRASSQSDRIARIPPGRSTARSCPCAAACDARSTGSADCAAPGILQSPPPAFGNRRRLRGTRRDRSSRRTARPGATLRRRRSRQSRRPNTGSVAA